VIGPVAFLVLGSSVTLAAFLTIWLVALFAARIHDSVVVWQRAFGFALGVEFGAAIATVAGVLMLGAGATPELLVGLFAAVATGRALAHAVHFRVLRAGSGWRFDPDELRRSWPFFALTFSGALQSRIDLYVVAALLAPAEIGAYQVLTAVVLLVQSMSGALLNPVVPALYRAARPQVIAGARRLLLTGVLVSTAGVVVLVLGVAWLYELSLTPGLVAVSWLAMLPAFGYLPLVYLAFREGDERVVVVANVIGILLSGALALVLVPRFGLVGAMASAAAGQVAIAVIHAMRTRVQREHAAVPGLEVWKGTQVETPDALPDM
jgi:O-antigen/teichoic acid export membrane protein